MAEGGHGQAQGFEESDACVAFAGGIVTSGPLRTEVTALVVRLPGGQVLRLGNPGISPVVTTTEDESWHLTGRGYWESVETADGPRPVLGPQFRMSATPRQLRGGPPEPGESNTAIYSSLGLAAAEIESLRHAGVV